MNRIKWKYALICFLVFLWIPVCVSANMVWPSLYIAEGLRSWYVILIGLGIEIIFVKYYFKQSILKSCFIGIIMNLVSTVAGIVFIPLSGFIGEILMIPFGTGTFHISHWFMSYILAIISNVIFEGVTVNCIFKFSFKKCFGGCVQQTQLVL